MDGPVCPEGRRFRYLKGDSMRMNAYRCVAVACLVLTGWGSSPTRFIMGPIACCQAQEQERSKSMSALIEEVTTFHVGGGAFVQTTPYAGVDARVYPAPVVAYEGERLYVRSAIVGYRLISENGLMIGPQVEPRVDGFSADDSPFLHGMRDRNWSVDGGVNLEAATPVGLLGASIITDLLGRHRGQEVEFRYLIMFPALGFHFIPSGGMRWKSDNLVDYYYGVRPSEARPGRPAYEGKQAFDPFLRLVVRRSLTKHWSLFSDARYEWLASEITNSPIVDKDYQLSVTVGALYAW
jgi:outer membrane protein